MSNATFALSSAFTDGSKPIVAPLGVVAPYTAEQESRVDIPDSLPLQTFTIDFGSIDDTGATVLIIQNATDNQEMLLDINDNGWTHGLAAGAVFGIVSPTVDGNVPITQAALTMKNNQGAASSFSTLVLGDPV
jgi:hypothetical protein